MAEASLRTKGARRCTNPDCEYAAGGSWDAWSCSATAASSVAAAVATRYNAGRGHRQRTRTTRCVSARALYSHALESAREVKEWQARQSARPTDRARERSCTRSATRTVASRTSRPTSARTDLTSSAGARAGSRQEAPALSKENGADGQTRTADRRFTNSAPTVRVHPPSSVALWFRRICVWASALLFVLGCHAGCTTGCSGRLSSCIQGH